MLGLSQGLASATSLMLVLLHPVAAAARQQEGDLVTEELRSRIERLRTTLDTALVTLPALFEENLDPRVLDPIVRSLDEQLGVAVSGAAPRDTSSWITGAS